MKFILFATLLAACSMPASSAEPLTATELAKHFGISHWKSTIDLAPGSFSVAVAEITDGKVHPVFLGGITGPATDRDGQTLAVMASTEADGTYVSVSIGSSSMNNRAVRAKLRVPILHGRGLPEKLAAGHYVIGGEYVTRNGTATVSGKAEDVKKGLLLIITSN